MALFKILSSQSFTSELDNFVLLKFYTQLYLIAERKGFEPPVPLRVQLLSREPRSTTPAPLQNFNEQH